MKTRRMGSTRAVGKYVVVLLCACGLYAVATPQAEAIPMPYGSNSYEFVQVINSPFDFTNPEGNVWTSNSWAAGKTAAAASTHMGVNGHLATVTSQGENDFLYSLVSGLYPGTFLGGWLGGKAPEGWLDGPENGSPFSYTNWNPLEPNNVGQAYLRLQTGMWYDDSSNVGPVFPGDGIPTVPPLQTDPVIGYFVEYEGTAAVIPEPSTILLLGAGFAGLAVLRRKRRS